MEITSEHLFSINQSRVYRKMPELTLEQANAAAVDLPPGDTAEYLVINHFNDEGQPVELVVTEVLKDPVEALKATNPELVNPPENENLPAEAPEQPVKLQLETMTKAELVDFAESNGIEVNAHDTKADIINAIEVALTAKVPSE